MTVVIVGATAVIGAQIAIAFAPGNDVILISREGSRLDSVIDGCKAVGVKTVTKIVHDLRADTAGSLTALRGLPVDVIVNVASSTSQLRDDEISQEEFENHILVDLLSPVRFLRGVVKDNRGHPIHIIFISSVLAGLRSPNRLIYSSLKVLQEEFVKKAECPKKCVTVTIVRIAKVIPPNCVSGDSVRLARAVVAAFQNKRRSVYFGVSGLVLLCLFYIQPMAFRWTMLLQRLLREPGRRGRTAG